MKGTVRHYLYTVLNHYVHLCSKAMGLLPDTQNCSLRMRRECRARFPRHRLQRRPLVCDPGMHHDTCVTHVSWCMSGSLTRGGGENVPGIPGACAIRNVTYLARGPLCNNYLFIGLYCIQHKLHQNVFINRVRFQLLFVLGVHMWLLFETHMAGSGYGEQRYHWQ